MLHKNKNETIAVYRMKENKQQKEEKMKEFQGKA